MSRVPLSRIIELALDEVDVDGSTTYPIAGVYGFGRGAFRREPISGTDTSYKRLNQLRAGRLVMSRLKAFEGAVAIVPAELDGYFVSQEFPTFDLDEKLVLPAYIGFLCQWPGFWESLAAASKGVGARRERVHPDQLMSLEIPLPSITDQRRIVARLGLLFSRVDRIAEIAARSDRLGAALFASTASDLLGDLTDAPRASVADIAEVIMGQSPPGYAYNEEGEGMPLLNGPTEFGRLSPVPRQWTTNVTKLCEPGDLLMSVRASIGRTNWADSTYCLGRGVAALRPRSNDIYPGYLRQALRAQGPELKRLSSGSTFLNLSGAKLRRVLIPIPPLDAQVGLASRVDRIEERSLRISDLASRRLRVVGALREAVLTQTFHAV